MVRLEEHLKRRAEFRKRLLRLNDRRRPGRRPRDEVSERIQMRLLRARYERWLKSGRLQRLGPRHWRFNPEIPDFPEEESGRT